MRKSEENTPVATTLIAACAIVLLALTGCTSQGFFCPPRGGGPSQSAPDAAPPTCGALRVWYSFDESVGPVIDQSGCGNHGMATASVARDQPGAFGRSFHFGGSGFVEAPSSVSLGHLDAFTVEAWLYHDDNGWFDTIVDNYNFIFTTGSNSEPELSLDDTLICYGWGTYGATPSLTPGSWHHAAVSVDPATQEMVFYIDFSAVETTMVDLAYCDSHQPLTVGIMASGASHTHSLPWNGRIDELKIWGVARSAAEICGDGGGQWNNGLCEPPPRCD